MFKKYLSWEYYTSILLGKSSYKTFLVFVVFSFIFTLYYSFQVLRVGLPFATNAPKYIENIVDKTIPGDLTVRIKNGVVSTNVSEPYYVTIPKEYLESLSGLTKFDPTTISKIRILTIDTKANAEDFERYQTLALLTDSSIIYYNDSNVTITSLRDTEDFTFNKQKVFDLISQVNAGNRLGKMLFVLLFISPLFIFLGILSGVFFTYLYLAFLVYIISRLYGVGARFMNVYRYTVSVSIVLVFLWSLILVVPLFFEYLLPLDSLHTILVLGVSYLGIRNYKKHLKKS